LKADLKAAVSSDEAMDASLSEKYRSELRDPVASKELFSKMVIYEDESVIAINKPNGYSS
jgi:23S rRNA-/tRNA-specific pseudouridylate synthase